MRVIKRYPNRKLYDTEAKQYVTLDGIAGLIQDGQELRVVDHTTGEDLTAVALTQIIFEQEKKQAGFVPRPVLTGLVQAGGRRLSILRRTLALSLDLARHVDEEIDRRVQTLIRVGELDPEEGKRLRDRLLAAASQEGGGLSDSELERLLAEQGVPTREEFRQLEQRLEMLVSRLDGILDDDVDG